MGESMTYRFDVLCWTCKHFIDEVGNWHCPAFPGGIPEEILSGSYDHRSPVEGDHGIHYSPKGEGLPDILDYNLFIVFCGTAVGIESVKKKCYYCHPSNKFWNQFSKITGHKLSPKSFEDCKDVLKYHIGFTDLNKKEIGSDKTITRGGFDTELFRENILDYSPKLIVFNGKKAAEVFFSKSPVTYGLQNEKLGTSAIFIAPSTSGSSGKDWKEYGLNCWNKIGDMYNDMKKSQTNNEFPVFSPMHI
jgi:TDG/mug DNA glycosylase family protein